MCCLFVYSVATISKLCQPPSLWAVEVLEANSVQLVGAVLHHCCASGVEMPACLENAFKQSTTLLWCVVGSVRGVWAGGKGSCYEELPHSGRGGPPNKKMRKPNYYTIFCFVKQTSGWVTLSSCHSSLEKKELRKKKHGGLLVLSRLVLWVCQGWEV